MLRSVGAAAEIVDSTDRFIDGVDKDRRRVMDKRQKLRRVG